ncbi:hypothetical protein ELG63_36575 [Rhizobium leguminosarum]|uniref:hypothetical protein n=1 Tax=Rhizobium leguminosarum TaxID=384 RepID=UPI00102FBC1F|nr:hypothetical protein [Rhizobium leguminosarum]TBH28206.1 hypothetical protein ELG63_36575 [Rhizobium leguminosarum]
MALGDIDETSRLMMWLGHRPQQGRAPSTIFGNTEEKFMSEIAKHAFEVIGDPIEAVDVPAVWALAMVASRSENVELQNDVGHNVACDDRPSGLLSPEEKAEIAAEYAIRFANESRQDQQLVDALFNEDTAAQGRIVFTQHALDSIKTTNDRVLTKRVLHTMEPLSCHPGVSAELLDSIHTMLIDMYYYGRERLLTQAREMGAGVKL